MSHAVLVRSLAIAVFSLTLGVVVLGAYVRLSDAGLGCPDWPGCYGHLTPAGAAKDVRTAPTLLNRPSLNVGKAWREMMHRYAAGTLGMLIATLAGIGIAWRRERIVPLGFLIVLLAIVMLQAVLGMLTVTWRLRPLIVTLHLLFGFTTLSLLWWMVLSLWQRQKAFRPSTTAVHASRLVAARGLALIALIVLSLQIALGAWTSSNYAAIACPDLPTCQGAWWPPADFRPAYVLWHGSAVNYEGGILSSPARVAIHLTHRFGAVVASLMTFLAALTALQLRGDRSAHVAGVLLLAALALQLTIGISMVLLGFPLWLAILHNAGAAVLLLATLTLNRSLRPAAVALP